MKEAKDNENKEELLAIAKQLNVHCKKVRAIINGFEDAQINNKEFKLGQTFYTTTSPSLTKAIDGLLGTYVTLRSKVREVAQIGHVSFENSFPELNINFETYYSVAVSLMNLTFQMQLLKLYCYRLFKK